MRARPTLGLQMNETRRFVKERLEQCQRESTPLLVASLDEAFQAFKGNITGRDLSRIFEAIPGFHSLSPSITAGDYEWFEVAVFRAKVGGEGRIIIAFPYASEGKPERPVAVYLTGTEPINLEHLQDLMERVAEGLREFL